MKGNQLEINKLNVVQDQERKKDHESKKYQYLLTYGHMIPMPIFSPFHLDSFHNH